MKSWTVVGDLKIRLLGDLVDHVQAKTANTFVHPPEDHVIDFSSELWIFPVQVRLLYGKLMKIILL